MDGLEQQRMILLVLARAQEPIGELEHFLEIATPLFEVQHRLAEVTWIPRLHVQDQRSAQRRCELLGGRLAVVSGLFAGFVRRRLLAAARWRHRALPRRTTQQAAHDVGGRDDADDLLVLVDDRCSVHTGIDQPLGRITEARMGPQADHGSMHQLLDGQPLVEIIRAIRRGLRQEAFELHHVRRAQHADEPTVANDRQVMDRILEEAVEHLADRTIGLDHHDRLGHDPRNRFVGSHSLPPVEGYPRDLATQCDRVPIDAVTVSRCSRRSRQLSIRVVASRGCSV